MKEVIIKYKDSQVLELLKGLAKYLNFSISEVKATSKKSQNISAFTVLHVDSSKAKNYKFDRDSANER
jgi:hypothetical protein